VCGCSLASLCGEIVFAVRKGDAMRWGLRLVCRMRCKRRVQLASDLPLEWFADHDAGLSRLAASALDFPELPAADFRRFAQVVWATAHIATDQQRASARSMLETGV
jgi:hypothetical protein